MKANVGSLDRLLRVAVGVVLLALTLAGTIGVWGWVGLLPLLSGALGFCPAYRLLGLSTCPADAARRSR
jgi:Protein of unknown function (DUF2892)